MGKDTKRAYKVVPVDEDEPDFGDPPRNWGRVASMAGVWVVVLLGSAWMAPGFASGGSDEDLPASEQPPTDPIDASDRYFDYGFGSDFDAAREVLCEGAEPEVTPEALGQLRSEYEVYLKEYPAVEILPVETGSTGGQTHLKVTVTFIGGERNPSEAFQVVTEAVGDTYCVASVSGESSGDDPDEAKGPGGRELAAEYLDSIVREKNPDPEHADSLICKDDYEGPKPQELLEAIQSWEESNVKATSYILRHGEEPVPAADGSLTYQYHVVLDPSGQGDFRFLFEVTVTPENCVSSLVQIEDEDPLPIGGN
ncbi:hypothetical protein [Glycomyces arizonensis]|uniref:hypothetical protein n=1 Tax=Glycomyces arizonensis TaxID=256035 RepID=UPI00047E8999|nr:hypothetical protein [Glycomyces arizonensis]